MDRRNSNRRWQWIELSHIAMTTGGCHNERLLPIQVPRVLPPSNPFVDTVATHLQTQTNHHPRIRRSMGSTLNDLIECRASERLLEPSQHLASGPEGAELGSFGLPLIIQDVVVGAVLQTFEHNFQEKRFRF
ncbi:MAG: hypothetical protein AAF670_19540 [Planctomycetota bacterium]